MGITIHFSGRLRRPEDVAGLVEEVVDIAKTLEWPHQEIRSDLRGVSVTPDPQCDGLALLFDPRGALRNPILEAEGFFCKTQFAPASVHVAIVKLLRHLGQRWFAELTVNDEGDYWETGDREELERRRKAVERAIDRVEKKLRKANPRHPEESGEDLAARIERILAEHKGKPIEVTEDERRRALGPGGPDPEEAAGWNVERWMEHFQKHDEAKNPLLREMRGRPETEKSLREAVRRAEEEERKDQEASLKYLARAERMMRGREEEEEEPEPDEPEEEEPAWKASLPGADPDDDDKAEDEPYRLGTEFARQLHLRLPKRTRLHPALRYVMALMHSSLIGERMGHHWAKDVESPHPLTARRRLGAGRFRSIARLLRSFPKLKMEDLAAGAEKVARAFAKAASG